MSLRQNRPIEVNIFQQLQAPEEAFKNPVQLTFIRTLIEILHRMYGAMVSNQSANTALLLSSPNGTVYKVTVDDLGNLVVVNARA